jgi:tRNA threonylcarbamoyl adenosine modification protein YjeE
MKISSIRELGKIADKIKKILLPGDVVFLHGEIGVGKTTFARLLINGFENEKKLKKSEILSPTFNIVFEYQIKEFTIKHFDLYRLKNSNDIKNVGLFENLEQSITLIEWPELIINKPENRFDLFFKYAEDYNERSLIIKTNGRLKNHEI